MVGPPDKTAALDLDEAALDAALLAALATGSPAAAAAELAAATGRPRRELYRRALDLKAARAASRDRA